MMLNTIACSNLIYNVGKLNYLHLNHCTLPFVLALSPKGPPRLSVKLNLPYMLFPPLEYEFDESRDSF